MNLFTRWRTVNIDFEGFEVGLRLRAPLNQDGRELQRRVRAWRRRSVEVVEQHYSYVKGTASAEPPDAYAMFEEAFGDEWARLYFARNVRLVEPLKDDDGNEIAGGAELYDAMGVGERVAVLLKLDDMAFLSGKEGKASSSPSTSSVETTGGSSGSTAPPTAPGDGTSR